nr:unnamed protein product [Callosobruchus analis]
MSVSDKFLKCHSAVYEDVLDDSFIDKSKIQYIVNRIPKVTLRSLSESDFKSGILKFIKLDTTEFQKQSFGKFLFIKVNSVKVPAVFQLLCEIFNNTDTGARLRSFHSVTEDYYNKVISNHRLTKDEFKSQVKLFLPYAKLERLYQLCKQECEADIEQAALEIEECILYPELNREECALVLRNLYKSDEAVLTSYDVAPAQDLPGNLGQYYKVRVVSRTATETDTHHLFAKVIHVATPEKAQYCLLPFRKERFFFEPLLQCCRDHGLERLIDFCPKLYFASNSMLLFEDLSVDGYSSWNFQIPVPYNWLTVTVRKLARLHAMSIILEERLSERMGRAVRLDEEYPDGVCEAGPHDEKLYKALHDAYRACISEYFPSKFPEVPKKLPVDVIRERIGSACDKTRQIVLKSDKIRNVLNHGDLWGGRFANDH